MKVITLLFFCFVLSCSVKQENKEQKVVEYKKIKPDAEWIVDTVLEISCQDDLDMNVHQLYIDTTKTNSMYNWDGVLRVNENRIKKNVRYWDKDFSFKKWEYRDFPISWTTIRKKGKKFYLYDRCNGSDSGFSIYKNVFIFSEALESDYLPMEKIMKLTKDSISFKLKNYTYGGVMTSSYLSISKIDSLTGIYILSHVTSDNTRNQYVIPTIERKKYNLVVNHCPNRIVREYYGFENNSWGIKN